MKNKDIDVKVGLRLLAERKRCGYTQRQVAALIGVDQSVYHRYERGETECNYFVMDKLCRLYSVTSDYILGISEQ